MATCRFQVRGARCPHSSLGRARQLVVRDAGEGPVLAEYRGEALQGARVSAGGGVRPPHGQERVDRPAEGPPCVGERRHRSSPARFPAIRPPTALITENQIYRSLSRTLHPVTPGPPASRFTKPSCRLASLYHRE